MGATSEIYIQMQDDLFNTVNLAEEGELSHLDALLSLREKRKYLETGLDIIKEFENEKSNEIANEASKYPEGYKGYSVTLTNGRKMYSFKGIPEIETIESVKKETEERYKGAFEGFQKGVVQTTRVNEDDPESPLGWIDENGQVLPFPEVNYGKSFLTVKENKKRK